MGIEAVLPELVSCSRLPRRPAPGKSWGPKSVFKILTAEGRTEASFFFFNTYKI